MTIFSKNFFFKKQVLSALQKGILETAIATAEKKTSGEIRLFIEKKCSSTPIQKSQEIFKKHKMFATKQRNGILIYVAVQSKKIGIWGDIGIDKFLGQQYWNEWIEKFVDSMKGEAIENSLSNLILELGEQLHKYFPYQENSDTNELSNTILEK